MLYKNLCTHDSNVADGDGSHMLRCNKNRVDGLAASTGRELRTNARHLERMSALLGPDDFTLLRQAMGLTYAKHGLLLDRVLDRVVKPTEIYMHD